MNSVRNTILFLLCPIEALTDYTSNRCDRHVSSLRRLALDGSFEIEEDAEIWVSSKGLESEGEWGW
jgi:hypothetical protein